MNLALVVLLPFLGAALAAGSARLNRLASAWSAGAVTLAAALTLLPEAFRVFGGEQRVEAWDWIPALGLFFAFRLDGLALLFALLILGIGLLIVIYARYYLSARDSMGRFYAYMLLFMGSMLGVVLSENLLQMMVFWELTSLSSFLLISYWQHRKDAREGARMALTITGGGGLALLAGVLMLGHVVGSYNLSEVLAAGDMIRAHPLYLPILVLVLLGVFTKSAQFPFHFWLPHAMAAPTPVSAYLHSATMVKAGVFLLARLFPALSGTLEWNLIVSGAGLATLLLGAYTALFKHDLKGLLAYSTISHLGLITLLFGFGTPLAAVAGVFHIINHATFKASLFMVAGIIDHETGTRDMRRLNGLLRYMPHTAVLAMIAAAALAGVPLLNGFLSKEMFFTEAVEVGRHLPLAWLIPLLVTLAGMLSVAYSLRFIHDVFFNGEPIDLPKKPHEPPRFMKVPVDILVVLCLAVGLFPSLTVGPLLAVAARGTLQEDAPLYHLGLWHGFNLPLFMSMATLALGVLVYALRQPLFAWHERTLGRVDARIPYHAVMDALGKLALHITRGMDHGSLQASIAWLVLAALSVTVVGLTLYHAPLVGMAKMRPVDAISLTAALALVLATLATVRWHRQRLTALITMGVIGLIVSLTFVKFSAPDLALTQLSVEVVTIVLLLLALFFLPQQTPADSCRLRIGRDVLLALGAGLVVALLTLAVLTRPFDTIAGFFLEQALPGGGGTNVVNVILVDFRGFDTLGEITVLALAALGIVALLHGLRLPMPTADAEGRRWSADGPSLIMTTLTRLLLPLTLLVAMFILLRGHNLPGGGFIAGLITAVALIVQYLANGIDWTEQRLRLDMQRVIAAGLALAIGTGLMAMGLGFPFLTSTFTHLHWPVVGEFELASAMAFDFGVFLVVVGATMLILVQLGRLSRAGKASLPENP
ncbi:MAG: monovalent cation/H+ antiporter subunit A [Gammaproteobacteria bacterium]|nr:monovalent cation/H+ antiporter subunit A [Gammaproteobacteria bacterium]